MRIRSARGQDGFALISSIIMLMVLLGLGVGLLSYADAQQHASLNEQSSESAFALAEAALNAQIFELSVQWPTSATGVVYPSSGCTAASNGAGYCPDPKYMSAAYPTNTSTCPAGTVGDAWNTSASPPSNGWTTYVRDGGSTSGTQNFFNSSWEDTQALPYDANLNGFVWVRAVGIVNCHTAVVVTKVSAQYTSLTFPHSVLAANAFQTTNNGGGSGAIIDAQGNAAQPSPIEVRCSGLSTTVSPPPQPCDSYQSKQVSPPNDVVYSPTMPTLTLNAQQLLSVKAQAKANGTYWGPGSCPTSISQLSGLPTYITGPCNMGFSGNGQANTQSSPGFLVIANGTISFSGTVTFYGAIYDVNQQQSNLDVVSIGGNALVQGGIVVDGNGEVAGGSSHKGNLTYDPTAINLAKTWGGAASTPNSFRQLPAGQ
jgi:Tfp pilus assembly protein PilX